MSAMFIIVYCQHSWFLFHRTTGTGFLAMNRRSTDRQVLSGEFLPPRLLPSLAMLPPKSSSL
jgi:hypothetical protein